jgi:hypothetical protein
MICSKYILTNGEKTHEISLTAKTSHNNYNFNNNKKSENSGRTYTKKFKGECNQCGKKGHKFSDCWEEDTNKNNRPNNWKSTSATSESDHSSRTSSAKYHCSYCNEYNHTEDRCFKKKKDLEEKNSGLKWHYAFMKHH